MAVNFFTPIAPMICVPVLLLFARPFLGIAQAHPWFRGIDWMNIHRYTPPYCPDLQDPEDTRHFDDDIPAEVRSFCFGSVSPFLCFVLSPHLPFSESIGADC